MRFASYPHLSPEGRPITPHVGPKFRKSRAALAHMQGGEGLGVGTQYAGRAPEPVAVVQPIVRRPRGFKVVLQNAQR